MIPLYLLILCYFPFPETIGIENMLELAVSDSKLFEIK